MLSLLKAKINRYGYREYTLSKENKRHFFLAMKLVAKAFIPNPLNKPKVTHINSNKLEDNVENLKWVFDSESKIIMYKNGNRKMCTVHRLVAEAYIPNPDNLPQVDHIDNDKNHNYINNLQWITNRDNNRKSKNKPILQFDLDGNFIREWECTADVGRKVHGTICQCLKGRIKTAYGYIWKYKE